MPALGCLGEAESLLMDPQALYNPGLIGTAQRGDGTADNGHAQLGTRLQQMPQERATRLRHAAMFGRIRTAQF
jgi:hypothetical protein